MLKQLLLIVALLAATLPAQAQERQWTLDATDQDAYLVFGVPETDDVGISFWCQIQSGTSKIFMPEASGRLKANHRSTMTLSAGGKTVRFKGTASASDMSATPSLEVELSANDPFYTALQDADRLSVEVLENRQVYPLADADIEGLLKLCRKP